MDRRTFLANLGTAAAIGAVGSRLSGCSGDDNNTGPGPTNCVKNGTVAQASGHSHSVECITDAELVAGNAVTLGLSGSGHSHSVTYTQGDMTNIAGGTSVTKPSTSGGSPAHTHDVTFG